MKFFDLFRSVPSGTPAKRAPIASALEPRMLFDGAVAATVADAASSNDHATADSAAKNPSTDDSGAHASDAATPPAATGDNRHEVVFVDAKVQNYQQLLDALPKGTEVVVLDSSKDGLQQIADYLKDRSDIDAIHILSHGEAGQIQLGTETVDKAELSARADVLAQIGKALTAEGDILLYGCKVAADGKGQDFLQAFATATGADVAASTDNTGGAALGGNWTLEAHAGAIETGALAAPEQLASYNALLAAPTSENFDGVAVDGTGRSLGVIGEARVIDGWTFSVLDSAGNIDATGYVDVTRLTGDTSLANDSSDKAAFLNGYYTGGTATQAAGVIKATSGEEFSLVSITVENGGGNNTYRLVGYRDGVAVSGATQNFTAPAYGSSTVVSVSGSQWQYIDEVRIVQQNGAQDISIYIDDIVVAPAVPPNAAPVTTTSGGTTAFTEGNNVTSTPVLVDSGITVTDADNSTLASAKVSITGNLQTGQDVLAFTNNPATMGNITGSYSAATGVLSMTSAGSTATLAQWQAALRSVTYTNSSESPNTANRTISFVVNDSVSNSTASTKTVSVAATNDSPVGSNSGGTTAFTEGNNVTSPAVAIDVGYTVSDLDSSTLASATVQITGNYQSGEDLLAFTNNPATMGNIAIASNAAGVLTLNSAGATATLAQWQAALRSVTYRNSSDSPNTANRTVSFTLNDGNSNSATTNKTVSVASVNDTPVATTSGGNSAFAEDGGPVAVDSGFSAVDLDNSTLAKATVAVTGNFNPGQDVLGFTNNPATMGNITASYNAATGVLELTSAGATATTAQWQAALRSVTYSNSSNAPNTGNRTISFTLDDGNGDGNTATKVVTISAANDAPVNSVPGSQNTQQDQNLVFSTGNGNLISISDVDSGGGVERVTLTSSNGLVTLSGTTGLSFLVGSGTGDSTMTFEGTLADINNALNGLVFSPTSGYHGAASLQITSNDLGLSGSGGNQTDTDTVSITIAANNPTITSVSSTPSGSYGVGQTVLVSVTFDQTVDVDTTGGLPTLVLETGAIDRSATYVAGSGSNTLTFSYTVQAGDTSGDLDYQSTSALALNGASIRSASLDNAVLTLAAPGTAGSLGANAAIIIDGIAATVTSVAVPANATYGPGSPLDFTVNLSENVTVDTTGGTPRLAVTLDTGGTVYASYISGSGTSALVFRLTVSSGQFDANGISLGSSIDMNGGSVRDGASNNTVTTLNSVGSTAAVLVDGVAPDVSSITLDGASPTNASSVSFTVTFNEDVTGVDISDFNLVASGTAAGTLQSVVQLDAHTYQVTASGVSGLGSLQLELNNAGTGIADGAGNAIAGGFSGPSYAIGIPVAPTPDAPVVSPDPQFLANPPVAPTLPPVIVWQRPPVDSPPISTSPLLPPPLFEQPTIGSGIPPLGNIFINQNALAPSYIAQVFSSSDSGGDGGGAGFLGFGGGDGGVFGSSALSGIFSKESADDVPQIDLLGKGNKGIDVNQGLRGVFGAPTLGQQLHQMQHQEQQHVQELATALGQFTHPTTPS